MDEWLVCMQRSFNAARVDIDRATRNRLVSVIVVATLELEIFFADAASRVGNIFRYFDSHAQPKQYHFSSSLYNLYTNRTGNCNNAIEQIQKQKIQQQKNTIFMGMLELWLCSTLEIKPRMMDAAARCRTFRNVWQKHIFLLLSISTGECSTSVVISLANK